MSQPLGVSGLDSDRESGWRVLAIDDDILFLEIVQISLERAGCSVEAPFAPEET